MKKMTFFQFGDFWTIIGGGISSVVEWNVNPWKLCQSPSWSWLQFQSCWPHDIDRQIAMEIPISNTVKTCEKQYPLIGMFLGFVRV